MLSSFAAAAGSMEHLLMYNLSGQSFDNFAVCSDGPSGGLRVYG